MNLFTLEYDYAGDVDWRNSARSLDNYRVNKMLIETAQLLSTAARSLGVVDPKLYKSTHENHPSAKYTRASQESLFNVLQHGLALYDEYCARSSKAIHLSGELIKYIEVSVWPKVSLPNKRINFIDYMAIPDQFKTSDPVESYRLFYATKPRLRYPKNKLPYWLLKLRDPQTIVIV